MPHAIRIHQPGGPEVLRWEPVELEPPAAGEVRLRHTAVGLNFIDTYHRSGLYPLPGLPAVLGMEAAGVVEQLGPQVEGLEAGQRVAYAGPPAGAYSEQRNYPADRLVPLPAWLDDQLAAAVLLKGMTAEYLLRRVHRVGSDDTLLVHAAAGGVGLLLCQWASHLGATVIGTVSSDAKADLARSHGCHHPLLHGHAGFAERVRQLTSGRGVNVVYDSVGRDTFSDSLACLRRRGLLVLYGQSSGPVEAFDPGLLARNGSLFLTRPSLMDYTETREELLASAHALFDVLQQGAVSIELRQSWPLSQAAQAHRELEARHTTGSSVLLP